MEQGWLSPRAKVRLKEGNRLYLKEYSQQVSSQFLIDRFWQYHGYD
jgi:hypothetical protein